MNFENYQGLLISPMAEDRIMAGGISNESMVRGSCHRDSSHAL